MSSVCGQDVYAANSEGPEPLFKRGSWTRLSSSLLADCGWQQKNAVVDHLSWDLIYSLLGYISGWWHGRIVAWNQFDTDY